MRPIGSSLHSYIVPRCTNGARWYKRRSPPRGSSASDDGASIFASISTNLAAGTYYAEIRSDAGQGEIGQYTLRVTTPTGGGDVTPPTADVVNVSPDPRTNGVSAVNVVFSEPVTGFNFSDLTLTRNGSPVTLTASQNPTTSDNITWTIPNLLSLTSTSGCTRSTSGSASLAELTVSTSASNSDRIRFNKSRASGSSSTINTRTPLRRGTSIAGVSMNVVARRPSRSSCCSACS